MFAKKDLKYPIILWQPFNMFSLRSVYFYSLCLQNDYSIFMLIAQKQSRYMFVYSFQQYIFRSSVFIDRFRQM